MQHENTAVLTLPALEIDLLDLSFSVVLGLQLEAYPCLLAPLVL